MKKNIIIILMLIWPFAIGILFAVSMFKEKNAILFNTHPEYYLVPIFFIIVIPICIGVYVFKSLKKKEKNNSKKIILDKSIVEEAEILYHNIYESIIGKTEKIRKQIKEGIIGISICSTIIMILSIIAEEYENQIIGIICLIFMAIDAFLIDLIFKKYIRYATTYKTEVIPKFVKLINNQLTYSSIASEIKQIENEYKNARFDEMNYNRFYVGDYITGYLDQETFIKIINVNVQRVVNNRKKDTIEAFKGIFTLANSCKNIGTYLKITRNKISFGENCDKVQMDSTEFEKYYDIYSKDKITTMRILTPDIMEFIIEFNKQCIVDFEIVINNDIIYTRFNAEGLFNPKIFKAPKEILLEYYYILKFIVELTQKINLIIKEVDI